MRYSLLACAGLLAATTLHAQAKPQTRQGFNISFGIGSGSAGASCDGCDSDRERSPTGYLRIGGTVRPNLVIAGEASAWSKEEDGSTLTISTLNVVAQFYPNVTNGFFVLAGVGAGRVAASSDFGSTTVSIDGNGGGYQVGTGYDFRLGKNFSLSPFATYFATTGVKVEGEKLDGNVLHFGLGFTWH